MTTRPGRAPAERFPDSPRGGYWASTLNPSYVIGAAPVRRPLQGTGPTLDSLRQAATVDDPVRVTERQRLSLHEAGHATATWVLGYPLDKVTVEHDDGGGATWWRYSHRVPEHGLREVLALTIAGQLAERAVHLP